MPLERLPRQAIGEKPSPLARVERTQVAETHDGKDTLQDLLASLKHLDLTGYITREEGAKDAHGGYCDVYVGYYLHRNGKCIKVAIKRLRVHILAERNFAKVFHCSSYLYSAGLDSNILYRFLETKFVCGRDSTIPTSYRSLVMHWKAKIALF